MFKIEYYGTKINESKCLNLEKETLYSFRSTIQTIQEERDQLLFTILWNILFFTIMSFMNIF